MSVDLFKILSNNYLYLAKNDIVFYTLIKSHLIMERIMKGIYLIPLALLLGACGYINTEVVEYRQVVVTPPYADVVSVDYEPVDVTTSTIVDYY